MSNNVYANQADELEASRRRAAGLCPCGEVDADSCDCGERLRCYGCGATYRAECECSRLADND
jgi:hypothetical protein